MSEPKYTHITRDGKFKARITERNEPAVYTSFPVMVELQSIKNGKVYSYSYNDNLTFHIDETKSDMDLLTFEEHKRNTMKRNLLKFVLASIPTLYAIIFLIAWAQGDYTKAFSIEYVITFYSIISSAAFVLIAALVSIYYFILKPRINK